MSYVDPEGLLLTALHGLGRGNTTSDATAAGSMGNAAMAAGGAAGVATAAAGAAVAAASGAVTAATSAVMSPTGRSITAGIIQGISNIERANGLPIPPGLAGTAPASQSAVISAAAQAARNAISAAKNNPGIGRPICPK